MSEEGAKSILMALWNQFRVGIPSGSVGTMRPATDTDHAQFFMKLLEDYNNELYSSPVVGGSPEVSGESEPQRESNRFRGRVV